MVIFGLSIIVRLASGRPLHPPPHDPLKPTFLCIFLCSFRWNMLPLPEIRPKGRKIQTCRYLKRCFLWDRISLDIIMPQRSIIPLFQCFWHAESNGILKKWLQWIYVMLCYVMLCYVFFCALSDETCRHCRKLDIKAEKFKMAAIQNAISYEIVYLLI